MNNVKERKPEYFASDLLCQQIFACISKMWIHSASATEITNLSQLGDAISNSLFYAKLLLLLSTNICQISLSKSCTKWNQNHIRSNISGVVYINVHEPNDIGEDVEILFSVQPRTKSVKISSLVKVMTYLQRSTSTDSNRLCKRYPRNRF